MTIKDISFFTPFLTKKRKNHIIIEIVTEDHFSSWLKKQSKSIQAEISQIGFKAKTGQIFVTRNTEGSIETLTAGSSKQSTHEDGSKLHDALKLRFSQSMLEETSFEIKQSSLTKEAHERLHTGFGWAAYEFTLYKKPEKTTKHVGMIAPKNSGRIMAMVESVCLVRDLVNIPANDMGPDELEAAAKMLTKAHKLKLDVIKDEELIKQNFPMIYDVGRASARRPRLLDFSWGNKKHPKVTLVGKGVCFDTGGLDIKPSAQMLTMKKDMGGSAHVLGLAHLIISLELPINLRVLIPAVENSISGNAYRPSDILNSRKGLTVEVGNTDAEGRLVLADALTYACEENPELLIDFATLTGAARVALGTDLPAMFCTHDKTARKIQDASASVKVDDPVWQLPLWHGYRKDIDSKVADLSSTGEGRAGATIAALFMKEFITENTEWIHMDCFAWEQSGKPGRPQGGADTGMRAIFAYLEERYKA